LVACRPINSSGVDGHLEEPYYAGLLTAAEHHGAAHHRPQAFQVIVQRTRPGITCGGVRIDFIARKMLLSCHQDFKTPRGYLKYQLPKRLPLIWQATTSCGDWISRYGLVELAETLDAEKLAAIAELSP